MKVSLSGGAYQARSVISSAQSQINLYSETVPQDQGEPSRFALYPMPGLTLMGQAPRFPFRGGKTCSDNTTYAVFGNGVYILGLASPGVLTSGVVCIHIGDIVGPGAALTTPVSMAEFHSATLIGTGQLVIVDGTSVGWHVTLGTGVFTQIVDPNFLGGTAVDYIDTYFVSNVPGTQQFQAGNSLSLTWDPLFVAAKVSSGDLLQTLIVAKREIWLFGTTTSEVWYNTGAADFPFEEMQGVFIDHGCAAPYSVAEIDNKVYWLSQDRRGSSMVLSGSGYKTERISTFAMETEMANVSPYRQRTGRRCGGLHIPAERSSVLCSVLPGAGCDLGLRISHRALEPMDEREQRAELDHASPRGAADIPGVRVRCGCLIAGDYFNGNIYLVDPAAFTDWGQPIMRQRAFPHLLNDGNRQFYWQLIADMEVGTAPPGATDTNVLLDWSDDRGQTFGNPVPQSIGNNGQFLTSMQWQRLGMARDRVFRLTWTCPFKTALHGCVDRSGAIGRLMATNPIGIPGVPGQAIADPASGDVQPAWRSFFVMLSRLTSVANAMLGVSAASVPNNPRQRYRCWSMPRE